LRSLEALSRCELADESVIHIFCDGAKELADETQVALVREIVGSREWCKEVHIEFSKKNKGLANSIIYGVSSLCGKYGKVIVLEDDLVVSPFFLKYMNDSLGLYEKEERVRQVAGYMFGGPLASDTDAVFMPFTSSWGWATWEKAWKQFDPDMKVYEVMEGNSRLRKRFNLDGAYNFWGMLKDQKAGKIDSWAIRWYLSVFMTDGLTLYPVRSLVENRGWDGSGTHCGVSNKSNEEQIDPEFSVLTYPADIRVSSLYEIVKYRLRKRSTIRYRARYIFDNIFKTSL
jgi:hypothetical protein